MRLLVNIVCGSICALVAASPATAAAGPLETAVFDATSFNGEDGGLALDRVRASGAAAARVILSWSDIAPSGTSPPAGFDADDPTDPGYSWSDADRQITLIAERGLEPIVTILDAPAWARGPAKPHHGAVKPDPVKLGRFARAVAERYSGTFEDLPRVRYWLIWNEPNLQLFLSPQWMGSKPFSPHWYRRMVNEAARAIRGVHRDNVIIAGALAPYGKGSGPATAPMRFMRDFLCLSGASPPRSTCRERASFDIWSTHPYSWGGPTYSAFSPDDVAIGDLPERRRSRAAPALPRPQCVCGRARSGFHRLLRHRLGR